MDPAQRDTAVRNAVFDWLERETARRGDVLPWTLLLEGAEWQGQRVPLVSMQGIFKPKALPEMPLSFRTSPNGPYHDSFADDPADLYFTIMADARDTIADTLVRGAAAQRPDRDALAYRYERFRAGTS